MIACQGDAQIPGIGPRPVAPALALSAGPVVTFSSPAGPAMGTFRRA